MVERVDPARTGVKAGRVVGLLTGCLAGFSVLRASDSIYASMAPLLGAIGMHTEWSAQILLWGNILFAFITRYTACYIVGSLIGVVYAWFEHQSTPALFGLVVLVGVGDGVFALLDVQMLLISALYLLCWLVYVPVFVWLHDEESAKTGPVRLGES